MPVKFEALDVLGFERDDGISIQDPIIFNILYYILYLSALCAEHTRAKWPHAALSKHLTNFLVGVGWGKGWGREE